MKKRYSNLKTRNYMDSLLMHTTNKAKKKRQ